MTTTKKATTTKAKKPATTAKPRQTASLELPKNPLAFEVLDLVSKQRSAAKKVEALKKHEHVSLKMLFIWNFDESVISVLPPGEVPFSSYEEQTTSSGTLSKKIDLATRKMYETGSFSIGTSDQQGRTTIRRECKNFYHFIKGGNDAMNSIRRESMFINLLQGLHPLEAELLCLVKDKDLESKYKITKDIVSQAYPDIQWGNRS
jgi:hypothetical protein|tara:strand:- start:216 stop:827 length:612 start_codon:yes stop_codon:yes gene_type:complete